MGRRKAEVYILTLLLLTAVLFFGGWEGDTEERLSFFLGREEIRVWESEYGEGYVFLPSYADLENLRIRTNQILQFDDLILTNGEKCEKLQMDRPYVFSGITRLGSIIFMKSDTLPAMYIDTASGSMDHIHGEKTNREGASVRLYSPEGKLLGRDDRAFLKGRGNSTFAEAKKPYTLNLSRELDLLGTGAAENWILLANARDGSNLRNKLVYDFAQAAGLPHSPDSRFVDLYLNGEYAGLYQLCERNEIHPSRVALEERGSFLVSVEDGGRLTRQELPHITTAGGTALRIHDSRVEEPELQTLWQSVENAIRAHLDPVTGKQVFDLIDLDSWARKYLIEEVFGNTDGGRYSQFFYRDGETGKICAGPVWDYDLAMSNPTVYWETGLLFYRDSRFEKFYVNSNPQSWFYCLYQNPQFRDKVVEIFENEFLPLLENLVNEGFPAYEDQIYRAANMNEIRWNCGSFWEESRALRECVAGRMAFLNSVWVENQPYLYVNATYLDRTVCYAVSPGETLDQLPMFETYSWYLAGTDILFDSTQPIEGNLEIELR